MRQELSFDKVTPYTEADLKEYTELKGKDPDFFGPDFHFLSPEFRMLARLDSMFHGERHGMGAPRKSDHSLFFVDVFQEWKEGQRCSKKVSSIPVSEVAPVLRDARIGFDCARQALLQFLAQSPYDTTDYEGVSRVSEVWSKPLNAAGKPAAFGSRPVWSSREQTRRRELVMLCFPESKDRQFVSGALAEKVVGQSYMPVSIGQWSTQVHPGFRPVRSLFSGLTFYVGRNSDGPACGSQRLWHRVLWRRVWEEEDAEGVRQTFFVHLETDLRGMVCEPEGGFGQTHATTLAMASRFLNFRGPVEEPPANPFAGSHDYDRLPQEEKDKLQRQALHLPPVTPDSLDDLLLGMGPVRAED